MSYRDALDQCLAARGLAIHPYLELGSAALLCQMVEQGMGLSFLPEYIVRPALAAVFLMIGGSKMIVAKY